VGEEPSGQRNTRQIPTAGHDAKHDDLVPVDLIQQDVLAHDGAAQARAKVVTTSSKQRILSETAYPFVRGSRVGIPLYSTPRSSGDLKDLPQVAAGRGRNANSRA